MLNTLLSIMHCPVCQGGLDLCVFNEFQDPRADGSHVNEGMVTCRDCATVYPVINGIPRMVPSSLYEASPFCAAHGISPDQLLTAWPGENKEIIDLQDHTRRNFGHEWEYYANLGWTDESGVDASNVEETYLWFHEKTLLTNDDISGKLTLDAGCGNGRFSRAAIDAGATVVSMDLTQSVDVAYQNLNRRGCAGQVVQGDILHSPFRPRTFDVVFTIGVIQHTGVPFKATACLASLVRAEGLLAVRTYRRGNERMEENDAAIRAVTTTFTLSELHELSDILSQLTRFLGRKGLYQAVTRHVCLFGKRYDIFDWYSAPVAAKLTYDEMRGVLNESGLTPIRDLDDGTVPEDRAFSALSIVGRKNK